jgi:hypothetical protein
MSEERSYEDLCIYVINKGIQYNFMCSKEFICKISTIFNNSILMDTTNPSIYYIEVPNYSYDVINEALQLLYTPQFTTREVKLVDNQLEELIKFAHQYNINNLLKIITKACQNKTNNGEYPIDPLKLLEICDTFRLDELAKFCCANINFVSLTSKQLEQLRKTIKNVSINKMIDDNFLKIVKNSITIEDIQKHFYVSDCIKEHKKRKLQF